MNTLKGACIIGQSGGPTAVINASVYGAIKTALECPEITNVYGAAHGIVGVLNDELYDMQAEDPKELELLLNTPSSELGSCRHKLKNPDTDDSEYQRILEIFKKYNVRYFFYNGGNDSMDTCSKINRYLSKSGYACAVMGIPKTIDNDLANTDHCPGFGSAARYIATSLMEIYKDSTVYDIGTVTIVEAMGRHAGWLAGSAGIASYFGAGPDLIYLPEVVFDLDTFLVDVEKLYRAKGKVLVVVSEGIQDKNGVFVSEYGTISGGSVDSFGHTQLGGLAVTLAGIVKDKMGAKVRGIELSLLQRCASHLASQTDITEAFEAGKAAVSAAVNGQTGKMVSFIRETVNNAYSCRTGLIPLEDAANYEKKVPPEWINESGNGVTQEFIDYVLPLMQGEPMRALEHSLPRFAKLKKIKANP